VFGDGRWSCFEGARLQPRRKAFLIVVIPKEREEGLSPTD
jgi:hypothetical protein